MLLFLNTRTLKVPRCTSIGRTKHFQIILICNLIICWSMCKVLVLVEEIVFFTWKVQCKDVLATFIQAPIFFNSLNSNTFAIFFALDISLFCLLMFWSRYLWEFFSSFCLFPSLFVAYSKAITASCLKKNRVFFFENLNFPLAIITR